MNKRIVLEHTQGRLKGLLQILGTEDQLMTDLALATLPTLLGPLTFPDHSGMASLITVKPRFIFYRETIAPPALGSFQAEQQ